MHKKLLILILLFGSLYASADGATSASTVNDGNEQVKTKKLNNPAIGSRQAGSEQIFGTPIAASNSKAKPANSSEDEPNNPTVGGRQSGSEQLFGQTNAPKNNQGTNKSSTSANSKNEINNPMVGGRQSGSEQLFGQSADLDTNTTNSK
jgi:hypothetical protein